MNHYFTFDRINNERILSFYSRKPLDFGGAALEAEGRRKLIESIEADFGYKFRAVKQCTKQVHGDRVIIVDEQNLNEETGPADGLLTDLKGVALEIHTADCQSVFLYDPVRNVIGNVHSGWKGTVQKIAPKAAQIMIDHYGSRPQDIEIYINPSILQCCFEIEEDVVTQFAGIVDVSKYCRKDRIVDGRQKYFMDTTAVNRDLLAEMGIPKENKEYHSYRGDHHVTGRNGSMICLK